MKTSLHIETNNVEIKLDSPSASDTILPITISDVELEAIIEPEIARVVTDNYEDLRNKPSIETETLIGDKTLPELHLYDHCYSEQESDALYTTEPISNAEIQRMFD